MDAHANSYVTRDPPHLHRGDAFLEGGVIVRGTPLPHSVLPCLLLPTRLPWYVSSPVVHLVSRGMTCLPRYNSSPAVHLVSRDISHLPQYNSSSAHPASGLALYRHPAISRNIMRHTMTSRNPRGTSHLPLAFRSRPGCPATSKDILRLPLPLLPSHPWDIPRLPEIP